MLDAEHRDLLRLLDALDGMATQLERGRAVPRRDVEKALDVAVGYGDECHHAKEDRHLFAALRDLGTREALSLMGRFESEHEEGRQLVRTLRAEASASEGPDASTMRQLASDTKLYARRLREHIGEETEQLLPLADALPPRTAERVTRGFERVDAEEIGASRHERFLEAIGELHARYAPKGSSSTLASQPR